MVNLDKQVTLQRKRIIRDLLVDTCTITPTVGTNVSVDSGGIISYDTPIARTWVNPFIPGFVATSVIPCRLDSSRSQQPDRLKVQTVVVDQYYLELPFNMVILQTDRIVSNGHKYEITKLDKQGNLGLTLVAIITELSLEYDHD